MNQQQLLKQTINQAQEAVKDFLSLNQHQLAYNVIQLQNAAEAQLKAVQCKPN